MKRRRFTYDEWDDSLPQKRFCQQRVDNTIFHGMVRLICMDKVKEPIRWNFQNENILVGDDGMKWLALLPDKEYYVISALIDQKDEIILWYIDMIADSGLDEDGIVYYNDLYLDLIVYPDGKICTDDMDELKEAFMQKDISEELFQLALSTSEKLKLGLLADKKKLQKVSNVCLQEMLRVIQTI